MACLMAIVVAARSCAPWTWLVALAHRHSVHFLVFVLTSLVCPRMRRCFGLPLLSGRQDSGSAKVASFWFARAILDSACRPKARDAPFFPSKIIEYATGLGRTTRHHINSATCHAEAFRTGFSVSENKHRVKLKHGLGDVQPMGEVWASSLGDAIVQCGILWVLHLF